MVELALLFAPTRRIIPQDITRPYLLSDVLVPSLPAPANVFPEEVKAALRQTSRAHAGTDAGEKIYESRRSWSAQVGRRVLENETELVDALTKQGFREITPEVLSLHDRIAAFAGARLIVGPTGSGLFNTVFASAGARVLEIEPLPRWRAMHGALYRSLGLDHAFVTGEIVGAGSAPDHPQWRIDPGSVLTALRRLEG